ncbi:hypothetical protein KsCSTR_37340 [Candidatus Kuenenia stuttgartiensis]|uniref:AsmA domain-containing protein n=3 Tax=Kuenenia stuttgartiensis TaxID=174633 RepID=A0A6G7GUW6_KUEST|nr:hypothetical protein KsCSTR_37340 [Candidatus Kuenenia stuttgartiensis]
MQTPAGLNCPVLKFKRRCCKKTLILREKKMKKGPKILISILVVLVVLIAVVALLTKLFGDRALKVGIEAGAERSMQVGVHLDDVSLSIFGGTLNLKNLIVDNPEGYQHPNVLKVGNTYISVNIRTLLSDTVEVKKIQLDDVYLTIEQKGLTNNLRHILNNLPKDDATDEPGKNLLIKELQINGVTVEAKLLPIRGQSDTVRLSVAPMTLTNLGTNEDINVAKLTDIILETIARSVMEQGKGLLPLDMINDIGKGVLGVGTELFQHGTGVGKGILEGAGDVGKGATDAIRGIFQRKKE